MCGIAGVVALDGGEIEPGLAGRMRDRILHRGPDGSGEYEAPGVSLAACRLAIVDLDPRGRMPMATPDGRYHIVHNGEIYNRLELRRELEPARGGAAHDHRHRGAAAPVGTRRRADARSPRRHVRLRHLGHPAARAVRGA